MKPGRQLLHPMLRHSRPTVSKLAAARAVWGDRLVILPEVEEALETGSRGVVCLETAIVTHGMPHPHNLTTALSVSSLIRDTSCVPATISILHSRIHIGLTQSELTYLSDPSTSSSKVSRRDIARLLTPGRGGERWNGGTTVAGTMAIARSVGIDVFVTGGIGGVHRGAQNSMDISADLHELAQTPMGVVCAGAKSILDIGLTLEMLETLGVNVVTIGKNNNFPAFYSPMSGYQSPYSVETPEEAARILHNSLTLPVPLSTLFAVPIPSAHHAAGTAIQSAVEQAVSESIKLGVDKRGKEVTPWLLKRVGELTGGRALESNIALVENNARHGGLLATELNNLKRMGCSASSATMTLPTGMISLTPTSNQKKKYDLSTLPPPRILVIGSAALDITGQARAGTSESMLHTTAPGNVSFTSGGVARNMAECASRLMGADEVMLMAAVGADPEGDVDAFGAILTGEMRASGMRRDGLLFKQGSRTAVCSLVLGEQGGLIAGVADMDVAESITTDDILHSIDSNNPSLVVVDANVKAEVLTALLRHCRDNRIPTLHDPTSLKKMERLLSALKIDSMSSRPSPRLLTHYSPNLLELSTIYREIQNRDLTSSSEYFACLDQLDVGERWRQALARLSNKRADALNLSWIVDQGLPQMIVSLLPWMDNVWLKCGDRGVLHLGVFMGQPPTTEGSTLTRITHQLNTLPLTWLSLAYYPASVIPPTDIVSTTGAGDSFVGGLAAGIAGSSRADGQPSEEAVRVALDCARKSLQSRKAVAEDVGRMQQCNPSSTTWH